MGLGPAHGGRHWPITPTDGAWATRVNEPISEHVQRHHAETHAPWLLHGMRLPGRVDRHGNPLPTGSWT